MSLARLELPGLKIGRATHALSQGGAAILSLAEFMASQSDGFWFNAADLTSTFQDTAAATPADDIGEVIGRINDLRTGGTAHNGQQATGSLKPVRQADGAKFDGSDDIWLPNATYFPSATNNFIVAQVTNPASFSEIKLIAGVGGASTRLFIGFNTAGETVGGVGSVSVATIKGTIDRRSSTVVVGISCSGSQVRLFDDAAGQVYEAAQSGAPDPTFFTPVGGAHYGFAALANYFPGTIRHVLVGREYLTAAKFAQIRNAILAT